MKHQKSSGFTLMELLVATGLGLLTLALLLGTSESGRFFLKNEYQRTLLTESHRFAMQFLANSIRDSGTNLPPRFPAIRLINNGSIDPDTGNVEGSDTLILRSSPLPFSLTVCDPISAGSNTIMVSNEALYTASPPQSFGGCRNSAVSDSFTAFQNFQSANGGTLRVYIYNPTDNRGEYFTVNSLSIAGGGDHILQRVGSFSRNYPFNPADPVVIYVVEERRFKIQDEFLTMWNDGFNGVNAGKNVASNISGFDVNVSIITNDTTRMVEDRNNYTNNTPMWNRLTALKITLSGTAQFGRKILSRTTSGSYLPRNVLSQER